VSISLRAAVSKRSSLVDRLADIRRRLFHHWARIGKGIVLTAPMAVELQPNQPFRRGRGISIQI
jgi:hypothetical protein